MAQFPFLKRRGTVGVAPTPAEEVQRARTRARQRLIGAVVLLGIGIVGFPLLFETQPRPIPVDVTIEIPRQDAVPPLRLPGSGSRASGEITAAPTSASAPAPAPAAATAAAPAEPSPPSSAASTAAPAADPPATPNPIASGASAPPVVSSAPTARIEPQAAAPGKASSQPPAATEGGGRFVVQVGAFADRDAARRTRERVERLGLKTYTQVIATPAGERTRVRVGPFASRDEADQAAARLQSAGLAPAVLTL